MGIHRVIGRRSRRIALQLLVLVPAVTACLPQSATAEGDAVTGLYVLFMIAAIGVFVVVAGLIAWSIIRHRAGDPGTLPIQTDAHLRLEAIWWAAPTVLVGVLIVLTVGVLSRIDAPPPSDALVVEVDGFQWGWRFTYPEADVTVAGTAVDPPRIRLPLDRPITFVLRSADVVHSFYVPAFLVKRDHVPGQENRLTVTLTREGTYGAQCGEFCGLLHEGMRFEIDAVRPDAFETWLASEGRDR